MRIVLDTNVVLSALLWRGTPYRLFVAIRQQENIELFTSTTLLEELAEVLLRPSPAKRLSAIGRTGQQIIIDYVKVVDLVLPLTVPSVVAADPDDNHVLAVAGSASADLIVSGDSHLLSLGSYQGIPIVTPADALLRIGG